MGLGTSFSWEGGWEGGRDGRRFVGVCRLASSFRECSLYSSHTPSFHLTHPHPPTHKHSAPKGDILASHTVGSGLRFFFKILCQWHTTVHVTYVGAQDVPPFPGSSRKTNSSSSSSSSTPAQWSEEVRGLLASMLGRPKLSLGYDDYVTFGKYYAAVQGKDDKAAAALASAREKM